MEHKQQNPGEVTQSIIGNLSYEQLRHLQEELKMPNNYFQHAVNLKLHELHTTHTKQCASCGISLEEKHNPFTLVFGSKDFKKKASFCGLDCLHQFTKQYEQHTILENKKL